MIATMRARRSKSAAGGRRASASKGSPVTRRPGGNRKARSAARREEILTASLAEFSERGFAATRLDDVARRAGIAKGTIYLYFRDKETLFQELVRATLTPVISNIEMMGKVDIPTAILAERIVSLFVDQIFRTNRKDVIRLMI